MRKIIVMVFALFFLSLSISANNQSSYSIVYRNTFSLMGMEKHYASREYVQRNMKFRNETEESNGLSISILRIDKNVIWRLNPEERTYTEERLNEDIINKWTHKNNKINSIKTRQEKVLGHDCEEYYFSEVLQIHEIDVERVVKCWFIKDTDILLKREESAGSLHVLNEAIDIGFGEPTDDLFEVPNNYVKK